MPEESVGNPQQISPINSETNASVSKPKKKKIWLVFASLGLLIVLALGFYFIMIGLGNKEKAASVQEKNSTSSATDQGEVEEGVINKIGFVDNQNIWVLDVDSHKAIQITKDACKVGINPCPSYNSPKFLATDTFVFVKLIGGVSELWKGEFKENEFTINQVKKFKNQVNLLDVTKDYKKIVFSDDVNNRVRLHIYDLESNVDTIVFDAEAVGRGVGVEDATYAKFSPNGSKIIYIDTVNSSNVKTYGSFSDLQLAEVATTKSPITIWDDTGKKIVAIAGEVTYPVWVDNQSILYKKIGEGFHTYNLSSKKDEVFNTEKDWTSPTISLDGSKIAYNKSSYGEVGIQSSSVGLFNLINKNDKIVGEELIFPKWVNNDYLVTIQVRKCAPNECLEEDSFTLDKALVVLNLKTSQTYEVPTLSAPSL